MLTSRIQYSVPPLWRFAPSERLYPHGGMFGQALSTVTSRSGWGSSPLPTVVRHALWRQERVTTICIPLEKTSKGPTAALRRWKRS